MYVKRAHRSKFSKENNFLKKVQEGIQQVLLQRKTWVGTTSTGDFHTGDKPSRMMPTQWCE